MGLLQMHRPAGASTGSQVSGRMNGAFRFSGNWRITFEEEDGYIDRLNLEDYH